MIIYLVRHAVANYNSSTPYNVLPGPPLSEQGMAEASAAANVVQHSGIQRVISSPMRRCVMTADPLCERLNLELVLDDELGEVQPGEKATEMALRMLRATLSHGSMSALALVSHATPLEELIRTLPCGQLTLPQPDSRGARNGTGHVWQLLRHDGEWRAQRVLDGGVLL